MRRSRRFAVIAIIGGKVWLYKRGTIPTLVGDWLVRKSKGTGATLTKGASNLTLALNDAVGWAYGQNQIDLTSIDTLYFYGSCSNGTNEYFGIVASNYGLNVNYAQVQLPYNGANALVSLDVSAVTGNYFIRFGRFGTTNATANVTCSDAYGVK